MATRKLLCLASLSLLAIAPRIARAGCPEVLAALGDRVADATCVESVDLTTNNPATTPADNSNPALPPGAFTPTTDRNVISPAPPDRTPIARTVPGLQIAGRFADDPTGQARFLIRLPNEWNGRLVVAGASGTRSEHNGDFSWSDFVVQKGYAYASQNKGVLNLRIVSLASPTPPATDTAPCRLNPASQVWVHFFDDDPEKPFTQWTHYMIEDAKLAQRAVKAQYRRHARRTYAVGTSNGGYQVRRAVEEAPELFDGGVDWEGTFVDDDAPNVLTDLPAAIRNFPDYRASGFNPASTAAANILGAGYPPDIVAGTASFWANHWNQFWEVTQCQWQKRMDPAYDTYGSGTGTYNYVSRLSFSDVGAQLAAFANSGKVRQPLVTVAGTMDALLPIDHHARAYARKVAGASKHSKHDSDDRPPYRLYEIQNGNHLETYKDTFGQLEFIQPHAQRAFDLVVEHVERHRQLPPSQCVARGASIADTPGQPGHCASLFVP
jgi:hypothetical protein